MEDDFDRRMHFCEQLIAMLDDNLLRLEHDLFSNERTFTLHRHANHHNCRFWYT